LPAETEDQKIAQAIQDVSVKAQLLVREEIELAKTEVQVKIKSLARGAIIGAAAGIFVLTGLLFALHGLAWLAWYEIIPQGNVDFFWGFFILAGALFLLGAFSGWLAARLFKKGSPPTPQMAIEEAQLIRETFESPEPGSTV
jgi:hypothetical protein